MSDIDRMIEQHVRSFVRELTELVRAAALESVQDAFGGNGAARRGRRGQKRDPAVLERLSANLLLQIRKTPGARIEQIAAAMRTGTRELMLPTSKLLTAGAIRKRGVKRATKYYPTTSADAWDHASRPG